MACSLEEKEKEAMAETRTSAWETHLDLQQAPHLFCPQFPTHSVTVLRSRVSCLQSITTGAAPKPHPFESGSHPCSHDHSPHPCLTPQYQPGISQKASLGERQTSYLLESCSRILDLETQFWTFREQPNPQKRRNRLNPTIGDMTGAHRPLTVHTEA